MALRVLHIGKYFPPRFGGIETYMSELMRQQKEKGLEVAALVHADPTQSKTKKYTWHECKIYEVRSYGQLVFAPVAPRYPFELLNALREFKPDILHIHVPNLSAFWILVLKVFVSKQSKLVIHWHSDILGASPTKLVRLFYPFYRLFEVWLLKWADSIVATSSPYLQTSAPLRQVRRKCLVSPLGVRVKPLQYSQQTSTDEQTLRLCIIGRLTYYKGHSVLLKSLALLKNRNVRFSLDVIGEGELFEDLIRQSTALGLSGFVTWHGSVSETDKESLVKNSDLLLLPSIERTEAFGIVLLEAAMCGVPALVTDVEGSGMTSVVEHQKTGLVVQRNNPNDIADKLTYAANNKSRLNQLGAAANKKLLAEYDIRVLSVKIIQHYKNVI